MLMKVSVMRGPLGVALLVAAIILSIVTPLTCIGPSFFVILWKALRNQFSLLRSIDCQQVKTRAIDARMLYKKLARHVPA